MASKAAAHFLQFRIQYSSIAFLYYDYALTFPAEVKYMWGRKLRFSTLLYVLCRYALVANVIYVLAQTGKLHTRHAFFFLSCDALYKFDGVISVLGRAAVIAALTGRTYAVYGCSRVVLVFLGALGITCIVLDIMHVPGLRCVGSSSNQTAATLLSILMCVFEFSAAILTSIRSILEFRIGGTWRFEKGSFFTVVFKQGLMYFAFMSVFTTAAVVLNFRAPAGTFFQRLPNAYTLPLSCTLIARFLLQLREFQGKEVVYTGGSRQDAGTQEQHAQTLTALRTNAMLDSVLLDDFGDGEWSAGARGSAWQTESTHTYGGGIGSGSEDRETARATIALHDIHTTSEVKAGESSTKPLKQ